MKRDDVMKFDRRAGLAAFLVAAVCIISIAGAQALPMRRGLPNLPGKESNQGVYVRDSGGAVEKLALAQRMERLKEWDKAADIYQEIIDNYPQTKAAEKAKDLLEDLDDK